MNAPLVVLDTPTLYYRAFYALPDTMTDSAGMPINAVRGTLDTIASLVDLTGSRRIVAAMDADWRPAFRTEVVPEYKAQRIKDAEAGTEIPTELAVQLPLLEQMLAAAGIPVAEVAGTEADDVIASLVVGTAEPVVIVSSDRDLLSLLDDEGRVSVLRPVKKGAFESLDVDGLRAEYGVASGIRYRELAALRGDPSDGLAGVPGIGTKTAASLLETFGDLAGLLDAARSGAKGPGLSPKRREALVEHAEAVGRTLTVMTCLTDLDIAGFVAAADAPDGDERTLTELASAHNLTGPAGRLLTALREEVGGWAKGRVTGFDLETTGVDPHEARIVSAALVDYDEGVRTGSRTWLVDPGVEIPADSAAVHGLSTEYVREHGADPHEALTRILDGIRAVKEAGGVLVGHNIVYDLTVLAAEAHRLGIDSDVAAACPAVVDTLVVDKHVDQYRKGKRTLTALAEAWDVVLDNAHDALADTVAAAEIAFAIARAHPEVARLTPADLHAAQKEWKAEQARSLQDYLRRKGRTGAVVNEDWPFEPPRH